VTVDAWGDRATAVGNGDRHDATAVEGRLGSVRPQRHDPEKLHRLQAARQPGGEDRPVCSGHHRRFGQQPKRCAVDLATVEHPPAARRRDAAT
jgi:hypothetical protein